MKQNKGNAMKNATSYKSRQNMIRRKLIIQIYIETIFKCQESEMD